MKSKKKMLSIILSIIMTLNLAGCTVNFLTDKEEVTTKKDNFSSSTTLESVTKKETTTQMTTTEPIFYEDKKTVYATNNLNLRKDSSKDSEIITVIEEYNKLQRIKTNGKWDYVKYKDEEGYVASKYTQELTETYVEVDISSQKLKLYKNNEMLLKCNVVTGLKGKHDTRHGCNPIYNRASADKNSSRGIELKGNDPGDSYSVYVYYWMAFDGGEGIHDADNWRYGNYGGDIYKTNGSHGCVSVCYSDAEFIYENTKKGDYVLVHE